MTLRASENEIELAARIRAALGEWRRFTIAVDGVDGAGKSTLARFLSWQLQMPHVETDLLLVPGSTMPQIDLAMLRRFVDARHSLNRPLIVEGILIQRSLLDIGVKPDFVVWVEAPGHSGSARWQAMFKQYVANCPKARSPDYLYRRSPDEESL